MRRVALLGLLVLAPMAQAGTPFAGRDLTPPAAFLDPASGSIGAEVHLVAPPSRPAEAYDGRILTPPAAYISPSTRSVGVDVMPASQASAAYSAGMVDPGADLVDPGAALIDPGAY